MAAATPGVVAAAVLSIVLMLGHLDWPLRPGLFGNLVAWLAISTPTLSVLGGATLIGGTLAAPFSPGRPWYKWTTLALGTLAWGLAFYWLSVPGLIELP